MAASRPAGPVAFLYARLSYEESLQKCGDCEQKWQHTRGLQARCPKCGWTTHVDLPFSIDRQVEKMLAWCRAKWEPEHQPTLVVVEELGSGGKEFRQREEGRRILANLQRGDFLIVCRYARGWRNARDFHLTIADCERQGVSVVVIDECYDTSTAMGRFQVNLSVALAQLERDFASERTREAIAHRQKAGRVSGNHIRFGQMASICPKTGHKIVVDNPDELRLAAWIYEMKYDRHVDWHTLFVVARQLGFRSRTGKPYSLTFLRKIGMRAVALHAEGKLHHIRKATAPSH